MKKEEFCYPCDFYSFGKDQIKKLFKEKPIRTILAILGVVFIGTLCMLGYYILFPLRILHEKCENWCFY